MHHKELRARLGRRRVNSTSRKDEFHSDVDKISFCEGIRLLSDKTQVHGLSGNATTRSRLTHSIEVSRIAQSLGRHLVRAMEGNDAALEHDMCSILHAAALLHDIGNPPFGHEGEDIINNFFRDTPLGQKALETLSDHDKAQFLHYEGNAQALHYALRQGGWEPNGSLGLTSATLSAFCKYPYAPNTEIALKHRKYKYGITNTLIDSYADIAQDCQTERLDERSWRRHPLAYISEAADDISYGVIDIEDAIRLGVISLKEGQDLLFPLLSLKHIDHALSIPDDHRRIIYIRGKAISTLVCETSEFFINHFIHLMDGTLESDAVRSHIPSASHMKKISVFSRRHIYYSPRRKDVTARGEDALTTILSHLTHDLLEREADGLPSRSPYLEAFHLNHTSFERAEWLQDMMDAITNQTDSTILALHDHFKEIAG